MIRVVTSSLLSNQIQSVNYKVGHGTFKYNKYVISINRAISTLTLQVKFVLKIDQLVTCFIIMYNNPTSESSSCWGLLLLPHSIASAIVFRPFNDLSIRAPALIEIIPNLFHYLLRLMEDISVFKRRNSKRGEVSLIFKGTCLRCLTTDEDDRGSDVDPDKRPSEESDLGEESAWVPLTRAEGYLRVLIL